MFSLGEQRVKAREAILNDLDISVQYLDKLIYDESNDDEERNVYYIALLELSKSFTILSEVSPSSYEMADVFMWLFFVPDEFLAYLEDQKPVCLVIFAHFCVESPARNGLGVVYKWMGSSFAA